MSQNQSLKEKVEDLIKRKKEKLKSVKMIKSWNSPEDAHYDSGIEMELQTSIEELEELIK